MANLTPSTPSPQDHIGRSSFRDDATVQAVADRLAGDVAEIVVLDCGCESGRLANAMIAAQLDLTRICYFGVEMDIRHVNAVKAAKRRETFKGYRHFDIRLREITDMDGYEPGTFDLVIIYLTRGQFFDILPLQWLVRF